MCKWTMTTQMVDFSNETALHVKQQLMKASIIPNRNRNKGIAHHGGRIGIQTGQIERCRFFEPLYPDGWGILGVILHCMWRIFPLYGLDIRATNSQYK